MTHELARRLVEVLRQEEVIYVEVRELLTRERSSLASLDADGLDRAATEKALRAQELEILEAARERLCRELGNALGIDEALRLTLRELATALGPEGAPLLEAQRTLRALVVSVKESSEANATLAEQGLLGVRSTLASLGCAQPATGYGQRGVTEQPQSSGRILRESA